MDETLQELVSRYLDGDLDDAEALELESRANDDPVLAAEIESSRRLRRAVSDLARGMEPPAALDRVMEPLRQSAPAPVPRVRPVYRWLGVAAALVLGVTVAMEVARRNPQPSFQQPAPARDPSAVDRREIFELAPLPTAQPDENRPLGAEDRLLDEEPVEPTAPEPQPLEVMGPLPEDEPAATAPRRMAPATEKRPAVEAEEAEAKVVAPPAPAVGRNELADRFDAPAKREKSDASVDRDRSSVSRESGKGAALHQPQGDRPAASLAVVIHLDGVVYWSGETVDCGPGSWRGRIEIRDSVVVTLEPDEQEPGIGCDPETLLASKLSRVEDGGYLVEIVVHRP